MVNTKLQIRNNTTDEPRGFYVYVHRKESDSTIFYVGKGKLNRYMSLNRNNFWHKVANKHGVFVEIVLDGMAEDDAHLLEIELIRFYGRRDSGLGYLVNATDGGEGVAGYIYSDEQRKAVSDRVTGEGHPRFNPTLYTFVNMYTHERIVSNRYTFNKILESECIGLFDGSSLHIKGWYLNDTLTETQLAAIKSGYSGKHSALADTTIYDFYNLTHDYHLFATRAEFREKTGHEPYRVISATCNIVGDWALYDVYLKLGKVRLLNQTKGLNNGRADKTVYDFYNMVTTEKLSCTRYELEVKVGKRMADLFNKKGVLTMHNWCLAENKIKTNSSLKDYSIYSFTHDDGSVFTGTRMQFKALTGVSTKNMFKTKTKRAKGWTFKKVE